MAGLPHTILRAVQLVFGLVVLALGADGAASWGGFAGYTPSQTAFGIFLGIWTMLVVAFMLLAPRFFSGAAHPIIKLVVDALTMLFWFAGFISLAVLASAFSSLGYYGFDEFDGFDDNYANHWNNFYKVTAAMAAFGAFEWLLFIATTVLSAMELFKGKGNKEARAAANPEVQV